MTKYYSDLTGGGRIAYVLTMEGCPYLWTTGGVSSFAWTDERDDDWPVATIEPTVLDGYMQRPSGWTEAVDFIEATLDVSAMTFVLHDAVTASGPAAGYKVLTWLASRTLTSTPLAATMTAAEGTSFTVFDGSVLPSGSNFVLYVNREAIYCSSRSTNTLNISARAVYGSLARTHTVDLDAAPNPPEVYSGFPGMVRRRVVLWAGTVSSEGVLTDPTPLWRGRVSQSPRLDASGAAWEVACDGIAQGLWDIPVGAPSVACRLQGYRTGPLGISPIHWNWSGTVSGTDTSLISAWAPPGTNYETAEALLTAVREDMRARSAAAGYTADPMVSLLSETSVGVRLRVTNATRITQNLRTPLESVTSDQRGSAGFSTTMLTARMPAAAQVYDPRSAGATAALNSFRMDSVAALPTTWNNSYGVDSGRYAWAIGILIGKGPTSHVVLDPGSYVREGGTLTVVDTTNRTVSGRLTVYRAGQAADAPTDGPSDVDAPAITGARWLIGAIPFYMGLKIETNDWAYAFRMRVIGDTILAGTPQAIDVDSRDWTWSENLRLSNATPLPVRPREWMLNGEQKLADLLRDNLKMTGSFLGLRRSRLSPEPLAVPLRSDVFDSAHTATTSKLVAGTKPQWSEVPNGIANVLDVTILAAQGDLRFIVQDPRSVQEFGPRRKIEIKPRGIPIDRSWIVRGARALAEALVTRTIGIHGRTCEERTITFPLVWVDSIYLGDGINITEWLTPNQNADRGASAIKHVVVGREIDIENGTLKLKCRAWPHYSKFSGWSPCLRLSSSADNITFNVAGPGYINAADDSTTDYAGSDQSGYASTTRGTVANDGGTGYVAAGYRMRIVLRDSTTATSEDVVVLSVNAAAKTVTLTGATSTDWATTLSGGGIVDMIFSPYSTSGLTTAQKDWPFICARTTRVIDSTSDAGFVWGP